LALWAVLQQEALRVYLAIDVDKVPLRSAVRDALMDWRLHNDFCSVFSILGYHSDLLRPLWLFKLLRCWRLIWPRDTDRVQLKELALYCGGISYTLGFVRLFVIFFTYAHLMACLWFTALSKNRRIVTGGDSADSAPSEVDWPFTEDEAGFDDTRRLLLGNSPMTKELWLAALYLAPLRDVLYILCAVDVPQPTTSEELWALILLVPLATFMMCYLLAELVLFVESFSALEQQHQEEIDLVISAMSQLPLTKSLKRRILEYHNYVKNYHTATIYGFMDGSLSLCLGREIKVHLLQQLLLKSDVFEDCSPEAIDNILPELLEEVYSPGDLIIRVGDSCMDMFFVIKGFLEVISADNEIVSLKQVGDHFGEVGILLPDQPRTASVRAKTFCVVARVSKEVIDNLLTARQRTTMLNRTIQMSNVVTLMGDRNQKWLMQKARYLEEIEKWFFRWKTWLETPESDTSSSASECSQRDCASPSSAGGFSSSKSKSSLEPAVLSVQPGPFRMRQRAKSIAGFLHLLGGEASAAATSSTDSGLGGSQAAQDGRMTLATIDSTSAKSQKMRRGSVSVDGLGRQSMRASTMGANFDMANIVPVKPELLTLPEKVKRRATVCTSLRGGAPKVSINLVQPASMPKITSNLGGGEAADAAQVGEGPGINVLPVPTVSSVDEADEQSVDTGSQSSRVSRRSCRNSQGAAGSESAFGAGRQSVQRSTSISSRGKRRTLSKSSSWSGSSTEKRLSGTASPKAPYSPSITEVRRSWNSPRVSLAKGVGPPGLGLLQVKRQPSRSTSMLPNLKLGAKAWISPGALAESQQLRSGTRSQTLPGKQGLLIPSSGSSCSCTSSHTRTCVSPSASPQASPRSSARTSQGQRASLVRQGEASDHQVTKLDTSTSTVQVISAALAPSRSVSSSSFSSFGSSPDPPAVSPLILSLPVSPKVILRVESRSQQRAEKKEKTDAVVVRPALIPPAAFEQEKAYICTEVRKMTELAVLAAWAHVSPDAKAAIRLKLSTDHGGVECRPAG